MKCVYWGDNPPNGFEERFEFSAQRPYSIDIKQFSAENVAPLHYAETLELLLCRDLVGEAVISAQHYRLGGRQLFVIPPYTVHSTTIGVCDGRIYTVKLHLQELDRYLKLENYLQLLGCQIGQLSYSCPAVREAEAVVEALIEHDGDLPRCLPLLLELMRILAAYTDEQRPENALQGQFKSATLQDLINWTNRNYARKITVEDAARVAGYSKYYFCSRFRELTGMTYMQYLNSVRVARACLLLRNGESVQNTCVRTGFENVSHFIQLFKRIQHITPHQYASQQRRESKT